MCLISTQLPNPFCTPANVTSPSAIDKISVCHVPAKSMPVCFFTIPVVGCFLVPYSDVIVYLHAIGNIKSCFVVIALVNVFTDVVAIAFGLIHFIV